MAALRLPMPPNLTKQLKAALTGYDTALRVRSAESANLLRASEIVRGARRVAIDEAAKRYLDGKLHAVPVDILQRVVETEAAETMAALAVDIATNAIDVAAGLPAAVLAGWGPEGSKYAATLRALEGPDGNVSELTRYVFSICKGAYKVAAECFEDYKDVHILNRNIYLKTVDNVLPAVVGPTSSDHPKRRGVRNKITMNLDEPTADELRYYDTARHQRIVQYWACCAIAAGEAQLKGGTWRVTADWTDRNAMFARYAAKTSNAVVNVDVVDVDA